MEKKEKKEKGKEWKEKRKERKEEKRSVGVVDVLRRTAGVQEAKRHTALRFELLDHKKRDPGTDS